MNNLIWKTCWLFMTVSATGSASTIINGGFETGNFSGWTLQTGSLCPGSACIATQAAWAAVVSSLPGSISPESGKDFAALTLAGNLASCGVAPTAIVDLSQTLSLQRGDVVSGWALICNPSTPGPAAAGSNPAGVPGSPVCGQLSQESAWVRIVGDSDTVVANPWNAVLLYGTKRPICGSRTGAWEYWQWQAPATGSYTLELGSTARRYCSSTNEACFDGIGVNSVPEPGALGYLVIGLGLFAATGLRRS